MGIFDATAKTEERDSTHRVQSDESTPHLENVAHAQAREALKPTPDDFTRVHPIDKGVHWRDLPRIGPAPRAEDGVGIFGKMAGKVVGFALQSAKLRRTTFLKVANDILPTDFLNREKLGLQHHSGKEFMLKLVERAYDRLDEQTQLAMVKEAAAMQATGKPRPAVMRVVSSYLGPGYAKTIQAITSRPELTLHQEYRDEMAKMVDQCKRTPFAALRALVEDALSGNGAFRVTIRDAFSSFDENPKGTGSLGQVHKGTLRLAGYENLDVATKIIKPDAVGLRQDYDSIGRLIGEIEPNAGMMRKIIQELSEHADSELNLDQEARNTEEARALYGEEAPRVIAHSKKVLITEWIDGTKIENSERPLHFAKLALERLVGQIFEHGFFHADPSAGNILVAHGKVKFIDWGLAGHISEDAREGLAALMIGAAQGNMALVQRGLAAVVDPTKAPPDMATLMTIAQTQGTLKDRIYVLLNSNFPLRGDVMLAIKAASQLMGECERLATREHEAFDAGAEIASSLLTPARLAVFKAQHLI